MLSSLDHPHLRKIENQTGGKEPMGSILYIIGAVLVAFWLIGLLAHIGGGLIHIILVIAVVVFLFQFLTGRKSI